MIHGFLDWENIQALHYYINRITSGVRSGVWSEISKGWNISICWVNSFAQIVSNRDMANNPANIYECGI